MALNILFAASEAVPFAKSGGLADVAGALPKAMCARQQDCRVVLPLYRDIPDAWRERMAHVMDFQVALSWRNQPCSLYTCETDGVTYYFLENAYYFGRHGLYGFFDDAERFAFFSKAVLEMLVHVDFAPDVVHCNDWQAALIPVYLQTFYQHIEKMRSIQTVFTIHNIQYQGSYGMEVAADVLGLLPHMNNIVEYDNRVNFMKGGIEMCHALTTVSPTYAREILDPWYGHGLDALLRERQHKLSGILNGIDCTLYDPGTDEYLPHHYSADNLAGKARNKGELQRQLGLDVDEESMVIAMVSRLVSHKGLDLVQCVFDQIMERPVQFVLLGSGDAGYEHFFREAALRYPGRVSVTLGFHEPLAHRIYSGADCFLMPSQSEPCGLAQMIALRYGTIPIVRMTGGLRDTVRDFDGENGNGNGYDFQNFNAHDMLDTVYRAHQAYQDKGQWLQQVRIAMACDYSWDSSAAQYLALYQGL